MTQAITIEIRPEAPADLDAIRSVHLRAFADVAEANLVDALRANGNLLVSLVAIVDDQVVAHAAFSPVSVHNTPHQGIALAPIAVAPAFQSQGIGTRLVKAGVDACRDAGHAWLVVLGEPWFYTRHGFQTASGFGLRNEWNVDEPFMALECRAGALDEVTGLVKYGAEFAAF